MIRGTSNIDGVRATSVHVECVWTDADEPPGGFAECGVELLVGATVVGRAETKILGSPEVDEAVRNLISAVERHCAQVVMATTETAPRTREKRVFVGLGRSGNGGARVEDSE